MQIMKKNHLSDVARINTKIDVCSHVIQMQKKKWATDQVQWPHKFRLDEEEDKEAELDREHDFADEHECPQ